MFKMMMREMNVSAHYAVAAPTCPWSSSSLLVSLSLSKLTTCRIHVSPEAGESGWM